MKNKLKNPPPLEGCPQKADGVDKRASKNYFSLPYNPKLKERAKQLRKAGILSEAILWNELKSGNFKGLDFDRQKIIGNYIVDFYCVNCDVVIEVDGESYEYKQEYDVARDAFLQSLGLVVIHIDDGAVKGDLDGVMKFLDGHPAFQRSILY